MTHIIINHTNADKELKLKKRKKNYEKENKRTESALKKKEKSLREQELKQGSKQRSKRTQFGNAILSSI